MSTKVYNAFRVKDRERLWPVLRDIRERGQKEVVTRLRAYYLHEMENLDPEGVAYKAARAKDPEKNDVALRLSIAQEKLREGFKKSATSLRRDYFDPDVTVTVTEHVTGFYLRAFCDPVSVLGGSLDFLRTHPELEDFHYQNSTEGPEDISPEAWQDRARIWDEMATPRGGGQFKDQLSLDVSSWGNFLYLDPWFEIRKELHENPPTLPIREEILARGLRALSALKDVVATPGHVTATTLDGSVVHVRRAKKRSQKKQWVSEINHQSKVHPSLERAIDWVYYKHMDPSWRATIDRWRKENLAKRKAKRKKETSRRP